MDVAFSYDRDGRLICELTDGQVTATVTASNLPDAALDLLAALESARDSTLGECFWHEQGGDYRWLFCRHGPRLEVAVMWCAGVITGWQHVFRAEGDLEPLLAAAKHALSPAAR